MLKVPRYGLFAEFVVVEGLNEEMIALGLEVQKILFKEGEGVNGTCQEVKWSREHTWIWSTGFAPASSSENRALPRCLTLELMVSHISFRPPGTRLKSRYIRAKS